jgi:imidazolonepropionase-like amidohydrolase
MPITPQRRRVPFREVIAIVAVLAFLAVVVRPALASTSQLSSQAVAHVTLVRAARLLDPRTGNVLAPAAVLTEDNEIKQVGDPSRIDVPAGAQVIDLGSATLLPGLIDGHAHLFLDIIVPPETEQSRHFNGLFAPGMLLAIVESPTKRAALGAQSAREDLESGITTLRNLGHSGVDGDTELRDAITAGRLPGPQILAAGRKLAARGTGYVRNLNPALADAILQQELLLLDGGEESARQAVRKNVSQGVDVIKITVDGDVTVGELAAVVDEAHRRHLRVAVHAADTVSIQTAIDASADSIEHGNDVTDVQLAQMRRKGIFLDLTPTFYDGGYLKFAEPVIVISPAAHAERLRSAARGKQRYDELVERVRKSGVKFAMGSDMCWSWPGKTRGQASVAVFVNLRKAGMPALDVIRAITTNAADMLGMSDRIGSIEPGRRADLIAVPGDPVADIGALEDVRFVMKSGQVIRNGLPLN